MAWCCATPQLGNTAVRIGREVSAHAQLMRCTGAHYKDALVDTLVRMKKKQATETPTLKYTTALEL